MVGSRVPRRAALLAALVVIIVAAAVLLAVRPWESAPKRTFTAVGTIDLIGSPDDSDAHPVIAITDDNSCYGALSFGDLDWSAPVTVLDGSTKLAGGSLSEGRLIDGGCEFTFKVKDVPNDRRTYLVKITDREARPFTLLELERGVTIRLGAQAVPDISRSSRSRARPTATARAGGSSRAGRAAGPASRRCRWR